MKFTEQEARQSFLELLRIPSVTATAGEEQACAYLEGILDRFGIAHRRICRDPKRPNLLAKLTAVNPTEDPMILISHIDVVSGDPEKWTHGLFSADSADGRIWARGTLDTKHLTRSRAVLTAWVMSARQSRSSSKGAWSSTRAGAFPCGSTARTT